MPRNVSQGQRSEALLRALRGQVRKDNSAERQTLFRYVLERNPPARFVYAALNISPTVRALTCAAFGFARAGLRSQSTDAHLAICGTAGERAALGKLQKALAELRLNKMEYGNSLPRAAFLLALSVPYAIRDARTTCRYVRFFVRWNQRYPFFVCLRSAETLYLYARLLRRWRADKPRSITLFSDGNPHSFGPMAAATRCGIPVVFMPHAPFVNQPARVEAALGIFYGRSCEADFLAVGSRFEKVIYYSWIQEEKRIPPVEHGTICVSLSKAVSLKFLKNFLGEMSFAQKIIVRMHPNSFVSANLLQGALPNRAVLSRGDSSLDQDLAGARAHVAGNSSVHLESLARGVPTYFLKELDATRGFTLPAISRNAVPQVSTEQLLDLLRQPEKLYSPAPSEHIASTTPYETFVREARAAFPGRAIFSP